MLEDLKAVDPRTKSNQIATILRTEEPRKARTLQYLLQQKDFNKALVKRIFNDWAVTLNVHPWALGILPESAEKITVPKVMTLRCEVLVNIFQGMCSPDQVPLNAIWSIC